MAVLIQYAEDDGPIHLHSPWTTPIRDTLRLIEKFCEADCVIGFNLAFDWFHLIKLYTVFSLWHDHDAEPIDIIDELALLEPKGRDGPCIKPRNAFDIMLHARKGPYQSTMDRGNIRIRRVPTALAWQLAAELDRRIPLADIYFARKKDKSASHWQVYDIEDDDEEIDPNFKDVVLVFAPSAALKALAVDALGVSQKDVILFGDVEVDHKLRPEELGYAPFALAIGQRGRWNGAWPEVIRHHISHWAYHERARRYACDDVDYTRRLYYHFGSPPIGDDDSVLACMVPAVRWKGFRVDLDGLRKLREKTLAAKSKLVNGREFKIPTAPVQARWYVQEMMDETEKLGASAQETADAFSISTKKVLLKEIGKWKKDCPSCKGTGEGEPVKSCVYDSSMPEGRVLEVTKCPDCVKGLIDHPAAIRAREVLDARQSQYEADLYDKFILAGRFHASFIIIGTLSSRMAGGDGLNAQGIKKTEDVRSQFPLAWNNSRLCGGDFSGFEVTLAEACYNDPDLRKDLQTGKKIHALFGVHVFPDMTYEEILATEGTKDDKYTRCKQAVFAMFYGGEGFTLKDRLGVDIETADAAFAAFCKRYKQVGVARRKVQDMFSCVRQVGGPGTRVEWIKPNDYIESMLGFRRYFTLENQICEALFKLANTPPKDWSKISLKRVSRRAERIQTPLGALQSALYGAVFGLASSNIRAAANHVIQSTGAQITKYVQRKIWDIQPPGIGEWLVQAMNIHDEIMCVTKEDPEVIAKVKEVVDTAVESFREKVPLIKMQWVEKLNNWAEKG